MNDTQFLNIINIVDYSIVVGMDHDTNELVRKYAVVSTEPGCFHYPERKNICIADRFPTHALPP